MKYMMIIYANQELWESIPAEELPQQIAAVDAFNEKFAGTGELLSAYGVADAVRAKTLRVRDGIPAVTDGPYLESKEYLASWFLIDVENEQRALQIAAEYPFASFRQIEVWPVQHEFAVGT
jgi:hypothetical protein